MNGASTNPDFAVVARAAVQVKAALEATVELALQHPQVGAHFREYLKGLAL